MITGAFSIADPEEARIRRVLRWIAWGVMIAALLLFVQQSRSLGGYVSSDFVIFRDAAVRFLADPAKLYDSGSAQTLQGFLYPPPAILALLPLGVLDLASAFLLFSTLQLVLLTLALWLWLRAAVASKTNSLPKRLALVAAALVTGPVVSLRGGQIDGYVAALVLFAILLVRRRPRLAATLLAIGCWVKIYPVLLLGYAGVFGDRRRLLAAFVVAGVAIPTLALFFVPVNDFQTYFLTLLPGLSGRTIVNIYNQSLFGVLARTAAPHEAARTTYDVVAVAAPWRYAVYAAAIAGIAAMLRRIRAYGASDLLAAGWCLALIPLLSPLGWGHTYVYALPLILLLALSAIEHRRWRTACAAGAGLLALLLPAYHQFGFLERLPNALWQLGYARYAIVTLAMLTLGWRQAGASATR